MSKQYRFIDGPADGRMIAVADGVSMVVGLASEWDDELLVIRAGWPQDMAYHRTHRHVSGSTDPNWFIRNEPEPVFETVFEWHERDWESPAVAAIKGAVREAANDHLRRRRE